MFSVLKVKHKNSLISLFIIVGYLLIVFLLLKTVVEGGIPFWYDPARDLLLALDNLSKPTLIGQPTGIPGLFYGPYWIWLLSMSLKISLDPRVATLIILTIPYITIFPLLLYLLTKTTKRHFWFIQYLLFITGFGTYAVFLWNPQPAFIITLFLIYLVTFLEIQKSNFIKLIHLFLIGLSVGFIINFHFSFGLGVGLGTALYLLFSNYKKLFLIVPVLFCGFIITFLPFLAFEYRHGFNQINSLKTAVINAAIYNTASVGQQGMTHKEITWAFINHLNLLLHTGKTNNLIQLFIFILFIYFVISLFYKFPNLNVEKKRALIFSIICLLGIYFMYQTSKNPIWEYHFAGVEVFYLVIVGIIVASQRKLEVIITFSVFVIFLFQFLNEFTIKKIDPLTISSLSTKIYITDLILNDANDTVSYSSYSPSIYTFDYDYLFKWRLLTSGKQLDTGQNPKVKYLIIPQTNEAVFQDFINYKTPNDKYMTENIWNIPDGTTIIKRKNLND
ncbi:hypothetical protein HYT02_04060 [Candidatus Gottesmanbacteria bacterium]|nr:hypothetical protein [Candidatus Gottesmanbacteria bacterium]